MSSASNSIRGYSMGIVPPNSRVEFSDVSRRRYQHRGSTDHQAFHSEDDSSCCRHSSHGVGGEASGGEIPSTSGEWASCASVGRRVRANVGVKRSQRARRHLANVLIGMTFCFVACWLPYNAASFYVDLYPSHTLASSLPFVLLLGHAHSALNPFVYWLLNESVRHRRTVTVPEVVLRSRSSLLRRHTPVYHLQAALHALQHSSKVNEPSEGRDSPSTTENALGVFHPRYTPQRPIPPHTRL